MFSPLEQFDVIPLIFLSIGNYDLTFFNIFLPLLLIIFILFILESYYINYKLIPSNIQFIFESIIEFILGIIKNQIGKEGFLFLPFIFTIFLFVLIANLLSVIPFGIALTSHLIVTM
jgi:F0F1-type ATP synthase membrane subunit a